METQSLDLGTPTTKKKPKSLEKREGFGEIVKLLIKNEHISAEQVNYAIRVRSKVKTEKSLLDVMKDLKYVSDDLIRNIITNNLISIRIGDLLVDLGLLTERALKKGLSIQAEDKSKRKLGELLVEHNLIDERKLINVLSLQLGFPLVEPEFTEIDRNLFDKGTINLYLGHHFFPISVEENKTLIAFSDPLNPKCIEAAKKIFGNNIIIGITRKKSIKAAIEKFRPDISAELIETQTGESVVDIINQLIIDSIDMKNVSDIHIEPLTDRLRVRFRLDGVLVHHRDYPLSLAPSLASRIKVMCKADITEKRRHQGGTYHI